MKPESYTMVRRLYKNDKGEPFEMTDKQIEIFDLIFKKKYPRNQIETYTQYGKSEIISMAVLTRASTFPEKWVIIAPSKEKARIIMRYLIKHIFENHHTFTRFQIGKEESLERIRREQSKDRVTFKTDYGIGEVFILSAEAKRKGEDAGNIMMGFGAPNEVEDESALIPDQIHAKGMRMLGGHKDNFLVKIGNPFKRNHFLRSHNDPKYKKIIVDYKQGIKEGRITPEFIDEMRGQAFFNVLYEVKFPKADAIDSKGYSQLLTEEELSRALIDDIQFFGEKRLGGDVAGGGKNYSVSIVRADNGAKLLYREKNPDTMSFTGIMLGNMDDYGVKPDKTFIDSIGLGKGVSDRLREQKKGVKPVNVGEKPEDDEDFSNRRAQAYWRMAQWIKQGGKLVGTMDDWRELLLIKYKVQSDKKIKIQPKEELFADGIPSPDVADALMLTFIEKKKPSIKPYRDNTPILDEYTGKVERGGTQSGIDFNDFK